MGGGLDRYASAQFRSRSYGYPLLPSQQLIFPLAPVNHCLLHIYLFRAVLCHWYQASGDLAGALLHAADPEGDVEAKADVVHPHIVVDELQGRKSPLSEYTMRCFTRIDRPVRLLR
ncbi:hypothetical protein PG996_012211 [Apiospora saccharicola]|uniref:Uncharacterized protein n=1 Tax=Apiospora saccharicola TaxID=335842 RepID=A0ABR1U497_9PEZI